MTLQLGLSWCFSVLIYDILNHVGTENVSLRKEGAAFFFFYSRVASAFSFTRSRTTNNMLTHHSPHSRGVYCMESGGHCKTALAARHSRNNLSRRCLRSGFPLLAAEPSFLIILRAVETGTWRSLGGGYAALSVHTWLHFYSWPSQTLWFSLLTRSPARTLKHSSRGTRIQPCTAFLIQAPLIADLGREALPSNKWHVHFLQSKEPCSAALSSPPRTGSKCSTLRAASLKVSSCFCLVSFFFFWCVFDRIPVQRMSPGPHTLRPRGHKGNSYRASVFPQVAARALRNQGPVSWGGRRSND